MSIILSSISADCMISFPANNSHMRTESLESIPQKVLCDLDDPLNVSNALNSLCHGIVVSCPDHYEEVILARHGEDKPGLRYGGELLARINNPGGFHINCQHHT